MVFLDGWFSWMDGFLGWMVFLDGWVSWMGFLGWVFLDGFSWMGFLGWIGFLDGLVSWMGFLGWIGFLDGLVFWMDWFLGWMDCEMCVKKDLEEYAVILQ
jgi:hypothetical protein